jgi:hypothetical protein
LGAKEQKLYTLEKWTKSVDHKGKTSKMPCQNIKGTTLSALARTTRSGYVTTNLYNIGGK